MINKIKKEYGIRIEELESSIESKHLNAFSDKIYKKHLENLTTEVDYFTKLEWVLRHSQSAKKMMLSSLYFKQATFLYENKMKNLVFYGMYYSLFNALLSNIILLPYLSIENITQVSHAKTRIEIDNYFVRKGIYKEEILDLLSELKMWREAYSYHLPLSGCKYDFNNYKERLEKILPRLYQTSELLSYLTYYSWEKRVKSTIDNYSEHQEKCDDLFFSFVKVEDDHGKFQQLDDDDYYRQGYLLKNSNKPMPLSWFVSERLCEDLECNWEQPEHDNDFNINDVAEYINGII